MRQKLFCFHDIAHPVRNLFKLFEENVVRAVHDDLGEAGDGTTLDILALCLLDHAEGKFLEVALEELQLLFGVLHAAKDVPFQLAQGLTDDWMQLRSTLILYLLLEAAQNFGNEWHKRIFEDLGRHAKLLELLLHLSQVHVIIDFGQLVEEHVHALVIGDVRRHELLQLLRCLLLGVHLGELLQRLQQVLLELGDGWADERGAASGHALTA